MLWSETIDQLAIHPWPMAVKLPTLVTEQQAASNAVFNGMASTTAA